MAAELISVKKFSSSVSRLPLRRTPFEIADCTNEFRRTRVQHDKKLSHSV